MRRSISLLSLLVLPYLLLQGEEVLTNESITRLVKAGLGEDMIASMVKTQSTKFAMTPDDVIALKNAGVSDKVIAAMIEKGAGSKPAAGAEPALTLDGVPLPDELGVYYLKDKKFHSVTPEILNLRTARGAQMAVGVFANAKLKGWVTKPHSANILGPDTEFVVKLPEGTDPAEYVRLTFEVKGDRREVELARGRINISTGTQRSAIPFKSERLAKQTYRLKFGVLKPGDYGLLPPGATISANASSAGKIYAFLVE
jgi:hypothetical protein